MWKSLIIAALLSLMATACSPVHADARATPAPEFTGLQGWINSPPQTLAELKGKVVLVEFWTYSCINCLHVLPHVSQWQQRYGDQGLVVIGIHTPEYEEEHDRDQLRAAVRRLGITYPVAQDNDYGTWNAYGNRFWPALYLVDRQGRLVYLHYGEGDYAQTEARIRQALADR